MDAVEKQAQHEERLAALEKYVENLGAQHNGLNDAVKQLSIFMRDFAQQTQADARKMSEEAVHEWENAQEYRAADTERMARAEEREALRMKMMEQSLEYQKELVQETARGAQALENINQHTYDILVRVINR